MNMPVLCIISTCPNDSCHAILAVEHLAKNWKAGSKHHPEPSVFTVSSSTSFSAKFDEIQEQLEVLASMDDLLSGML